MTCFSEESNIAEARTTKRTAEAIQCSPLLSVLCRGQILSAQRLSPGNLRLASFNQDWIVLVRFNLTMWTEALNGVIQVFAVCAGNEGLSVDEFNRLTADPAIL